MKKYAVMTIDNKSVIPDVTDSTRYTEYLLERMPWDEWHVIGTRNKYSKTGEWYFDIAGSNWKDVDGEVTEKRYLTKADAFIEFL